MITDVSAVGAGEEKIGGGGAKLIRFGHIWSKVIGFEQNQNLASPKTFDFVLLWPM